MSQPQKKPGTIERPEQNSAATRKIAFGAASLLSIAAGVIIFIFGINLSSDRLYFESFAAFLTALDPTPAMLGKLDYKIIALSSIAKYAGAVMSVISFVLLYLTLKGLDLIEMPKDLAERFTGYLGGRDGAANFMFILGSSVLVLMFLIILFATGGFLVRIPVSKWHLITAFFAVTAYVWAISRSFYAEKHLKIFLLSLAILGFVSGCSFFLSAGVYDTAFDSQSYHQESMIYMAEGWNPVYESRQGDIKGSKADGQIYTTSKSSEICAAAVYKATGNLEAGKAFNILLIFASFCLSFAALLSFGVIAPQLALLLSFLLALNPVSVYQSLSYYVDGQMSSLIICSFSLFLLCITKRRISDLLIMGASIALLLSIKLSGLAYGFLICAGMASYEMFLRKAKELMLTTIVLLLFSVLSFFCFSFNPFVTNHINHGHIFYPFYGKSAISVVNHGPAYVVGMNSFQKVLYSVFSESENFYAGRLIEPKFKFPLSVSGREMAVFANTDTRVGGFGPLFGAILAVTIVLLLICLAYAYKPALIATAFVSWLFLMSFLILEGWWARFIPQLFLVPFPVLVLSVYYREKVVIYLRRFILLLLFVNLGMVSLPYYLNQAMTTASLSRQLNEMKGQKAELAVYLPFFSTSLGRRMKNAGINYKEVQKEYFTQEPKITAADFTVMYYTVVK